jgi:hypothetical protein
MYCIVSRCSFGFYAIVLCIATACDGTDFLHTGAAVHAGKSSTSNKRQLRPTATALSSRKTLTRRANWLQMRSRIRLWFKMQDTFADPKRSVKDTAFLAMAANRQNIAPHKTSGIFRGENKGEYCR